MWDNLVLMFAGILCPIFGLLGAIYGVLWTVTDKRYWGRRKRRGTACAVFLIIGFIIYVYAQDLGEANATGMMVGTLSAASYTKVIQG